MLTIYKYPLEFRLEPHSPEGEDLRARVMIPRGFTPLKIALQDGKPTLWAMIDPGRSAEEVVLRVVGTGWMLDHDAFDPMSLDPGGWDYIDTLDQGRLVWHYFAQRPDLTR